MLNSRPRDISKSHTDLKKSRSRGGRVQIVSRYKKSTDFWSFTFPNLFHDRYMSALSTATYLKCSLILYFQYSLKFDEIRLNSTWFNIRVSASLRIRISHCLIYRDKVSSLLRDCSRRIHQLFDHPASRRMLSASQIHLCLIQFSVQDQVSNGLQNFWSCTNSNSLFVSGIAVNGDSFDEIIKQTITDMRIDSLFPS